MTLNAAQIGYDRTLEVLRSLLVERFGLTLPETLPDDEPLFAVGVGLSSLEGIEFLCEIEKQFGLRIKDLDWWVYETPTLSAVAQHLVDLSQQQQATR